MNYPQESGRWGADQPRPAPNRNYSSSFALDDDLKPSYQEPESLDDDTTGLQAKFKSMVRQKVPSDSPNPQVLPVRPALAPAPLTTDAANRILSRTNSVTKIVAPKKDETFDDLQKISEDILDTKPKELSPPRDLDDDDDILPTDRKADNSVSRNIKFFEHNDKAKVPLIPKSPSLEKKEKPARPTHIEIVTNRGSEDEYESGVDESPVKHPNLRSISQTPSKVARISSAGTNQTRPRWVNPRASCPGTPTRVSSARSSRSTPHTPKRSYKPRLKPEEELLNFFNSPVKKTRFFSKYVWGDIVIINTHL